MRIQIREVFPDYVYLVVEENKNTERGESCGCKGMKGLEEEDELEVLGYLLEIRADWRDGNKLGDIENEGEEKDGHQMT